MFKKSLIAVFAPRRLLAALSACPSTPGTRACLRLARNHLDHEAHRPGLPQHVLDEIADAVGTPDLERVPIAPDALAAAGVQPWSGPRSLPLWLPDSHAGMTARDTSAAAAAGLRCRPVADTARAALAHERALGPDRDRRSGLTRQEEALLLSELG